MATKTETTVTDVLPSGIDKILVASNTGGKEISLNSNAFLSLEYSESILHDTPQCLIQFVDTGSDVLDGKTVIEGLPLVGQEKVTLKFTDNLGTSLGDMDMFVNSVMPIGEDTRKSVVAIDLVSKEFILNEKIRLRKRFDGKISDHIKQILSANLADGLQSEKNLNIEETSNNYNFIGNNKKSYYTINWLCKKAVPNIEGAKGKTAGFLFFETSEGFHFKSIDSLCQQKAKKRIFYNETSELPEGYDIKALSYTSDNEIEVQRKLAMGAYSNRLIMFDPFKCKYRIITPNADQVEENLKLAGKNLPKLNPEFNVPGGDKEFSKTTYVLLDTGVLPSGNTNQQLEKSDEENLVYADIYNQSIMRYNLFLSFSATITIPADYSLHAGDAIHLDVPQRNTDKKKEGKNTFDGGLYIISDLTHLVTPRESLTRLKLVRESIGKKRKD